MPEYQFVSFGDNNSPNATKAARSHAIRTALHRRNAPAPSVDDETSETRPEDASRHPQPALRGRFRVAASSAQKRAAPRTPGPDVKKKDIIKWALTSKVRGTPASHSLTTLGILTRLQVKAKDSKASGSKVKTKTTSLSRGAVAAPPILRLKDHYLDPFESMPIPSGPAADTLLQYCETRHFQR